MIGIPLQFGNISIGTLISIGISLVNAVLRVVITYIAFQGYRRNSSRPMLFVAVGFFLVFLIPFFLSAGAALGAFLIITTGRFSGFAPIIAQVTTAAASLSGVSQVFGFLSILYGLRMPVRQ
jgi:hypothetical protein